MIFGIGINDADYPVTKRNTNGKQLMCPYYSKWRGMLQRCYSDKYKARQKTYKNCFVCKEWLTFSNFITWMETKEWEGCELDKDILGDGKLYSPETCCFIPKRINLFLVDRSRFRGDYPLGVAWDKERSCFQAHCANPYGKYEHLGRYETPEEAHLSWAKTKFAHCTVIVKDLDNQKVAEGLLSKYEKLLRSAREKVQCTKNS